jgi:hypothetical protein
MCNFTGKMTRIILLLTVLQLAYVVAPAQKPKKDSSGVTLVQDKRINELVNRHVASNKAERGLMPGFRVQIFFGASKKSALKEKAGFVEKLPDYEGYVIYDAPYFKVRVGDFRTHLQAQKLHKELYEEYPGAFIVKDMIPIPDWED